jgi:deazaflavin-dependent oxidoreductase (nitroreductase family)
MDWHTPVNIPPSLRYEDGLYVFERFSRGGAVTSVRDKRILTRALRALHRPWFAVWMPTGVAALTTTGRKSGRPRTTFVRAYRGAGRAYLISITGEHALWLKNTPREPRSDTALSARDAARSSSRPAQRHRTARSQ